MEEKDSIQFSEEEILSVALTLAVQDLFDSTNDNVYEMGIKALIGIYIEAAIEVLKENSDSKIVSEEDKMFS